MRKYRVGYIRGDGVGPEIVDAALSVLVELAEDLELVELRAGYELYKRTGRLLEEGFFDRARELDAILKGPLHTPPGPESPRSVNLLIRRELDLYANVRPFASYEGVSIGRFDFVIIRENTEDLYVGIEGRHGGSAFSLKVITEEGSRRVSRFALRYAASRGYKRVTVVHKANVMKETDGLFREVFLREASSYAGAFEVDEMIVDSAAYNLVRSPNRFGVIVSPNLYGDILSDVAAALVGSLGLCGSAQIGDRIAVFEPVHGTAPDIAGRGVANPLGQLKAAALMLEHLAESRGDEKLRRAASALERAMRRLVERGGPLTPDLGGSASTREVAEEVKRLSLALLGELFGSTS
ncbi:MAG: isocitrate/isopropylmalate dehydrogenase family protein [Fervidicoccaceae archaeon]